MAGELRRIIRWSAQAALRVTPWLVSAGAIAFGSWLFDGMAPAFNAGRVADVLSAMIVVRFAAALGAISAGSFAVSRGLADRWFGGDAEKVRRGAGLAALGAASVAFGTFIFVGPLLGASFAHSLTVVGATALLAGVSAWNAWALRSWAPRTGRPPELDAPSAADEWMARDLGRVKTPVT